jgi:hypothetical protein
MTSQAAILQLGEVLDNFLAIPAFSGFARSPCSFVGMFARRLCGWAVVFLWRPDAPPAAKRGMTTSPVRAAKGSQSAL